MSDTETAAAHPATGRSKLLMIGLPLVAVLLAAAGAGWWYVRELRAAPGAEEKKHTEPTGLLTFDAFTVNLADPGGRRYLRVALQLVVPDEDVAKKAEEDELTTSRVRSALIEVLAQRVSTDLTKVEGRAELKKEIAEVASHVGHLDVRDVLFQDFVVQ